MAASQAQTRTAPNRSFTGHRCQGCGQTGLGNTKSNWNLSSLSHTRHQICSVIPTPRRTQHPNLPDFAKVASMSLSHTYPDTQAVPSQMPPLAAPKPSPMFPSYGIVPRLPSSALHSLLQSPCPGSDPGAFHEIYLPAWLFPLQRSAPQGEDSGPHAGSWGPTWFAWCWGHSCLPPRPGPRQRALGSEQLSQLPEAWSSEARRE